MSNEPQTFAKWGVIWNLPPDADVEAWEEWYWGHHVPLAVKMPGQVKYTASKVEQVVYGSGYYRIAEQFFPDMDTLLASINSPEGKAVADDAGEYVVDLQLLATVETDVALDN